MQPWCQVCGKTTSATEQQLFLCSFCRKFLAKILEEFPLLYVQLHLELSSGLRPRSTELPVNRTPVKYRTIVTPFRENLFDHTRRCVDVVYAWATHAAPNAISSAPMQPGPLFQYACRLLSGDVPAAVQTQEGGLHALRTWIAYIKARRMVDIPEAPRSLDTPCPECGLRSLAELQDGVIMCRYCSSQY